MTAPAPGSPEGTEKLDEVRLTTTAPGAPWKERVLPPVEPVELIALVSTSFPVPGTNVTGWLPPSRLSLPRPPTRVSLVPLDTRVWLPTPPASQLVPPPPVMVRLPDPPQMRLPPAA